MKYSLVPPLQQFFSRHRDRVQGAASRHRHKLLAALLLIVFGLGYGLHAMLSDREQSPRPGTTAPALGEQAEEATVWTCAMPPQIRMPEPGQCPICGMTLMPVAAAPEEQRTSPRPI